MSPKWIKTSCLWLTNPNYKIIESYAHLQWFQISPASLTYLGCQWLCSYQKKTKPSISRLGEPGMQIDHANMLLTRNSTLIGWVRARALSGTWAAGSLHWISRTANVGSRRIVWNVSAVEGQTSTSTKWQSEKFTKVRKPPKQAAMHGPEYGQIIEQQKSDGIVDEANESLQE